MKTCSNCGAQIDELGNYCPHCGTRSDIGGDPEVLSENVPEPREEDGPRADQYPMKWHKFLMVVMILGGIISIAYGVNALSGSEYLRQGLQADRVYSVFPGLKSCDTFYGIALIGLGVFEFIVRSRLRRFCRNGPMSLKVMYVLGIVVNLVYLAWASSAMHTSLFDSSNLGSALGSVLFLIVNSMYYNKRSDLFVN